MKLADAYFIRVLSGFGKGFSGGIRVSLFTDLEQLSVEK